MPRPHSPDCLLWAKRLNDEHVALKVRATNLEKSRERLQTDIESLKGTSAAVQHVIGEVSNLSDRVNTAERQIEDLGGMLEPLRVEIGQLNKRLETHAIKLATSERNRVEDREDHEQLDASSRHILVRLEKIEESIASLPKQSPKLARKDDQSNALALSKMVAFIEDRQVEDRLAIQELHRQLQGLASLAAGPMRPAIPTLQINTPHIQESSSPSGNAAWSPLVAKQVRCRAAQRSELTRPKTSVDRHTRLEHGANLLQVPLQPHLVSPSSRDRRCNAQSKDNTKSCVNTAAGPRAEDKGRSANSSKKRKAAPPQTTRLTRSRTRAGQIHSDPSYASSQRPSAHAPTSRDMAPKEATKAPVSTERQEKPRPIRKKRTLSQPCELPPLEALSD